MRRGAKSIPNEFLSVEAAVKPSSFWSEASNADCQSGVADRFLEYVFGDLVGDDVKRDRAFPFIDRRKVAPDALARAANSVRVGVNAILPDCLL